jgi:hypothetical protein
MVVGNCRVTKPFPVNILALPCVLSQRENWSNQSVCAALHKREKIDLFKIMQEDHYNLLKQGDTVKC